MKDKSGQELRQYSIVRFQSYRLPGATYLGYIERISQDETGEWIAHIERLDDEDPCRCCTGQSRYYERCSEDIQFQNYEEDKMNV